MPEAAPYFIVGLNGGVTEEGDTTMHLSAGILRYADALRDGGRFVIFDAPQMGWQVEDAAKWDRAAEEMQVRLRGIVDAADTPNIRIVRASQLQPREGLDTLKNLVGKLKLITKNDAEMARKIWQIVPPSAKASNGFAKESQFSEMDASQTERALALMEYELYHVALIISCDGTKILHGRSEQRTRQVVEHLAKYYADHFGLKNWKGNIIDPPELRVSCLGGNSAPYQLTDGGAPRAVAEKGQLPLSAKLTETRAAILRVLEEGRGEELEAYLRGNCVLPGMRDVVSQADFSSPRTVAFSTARLVSKCFWPIEMGELKALREVDEGKFVKRCHKKVLEILSDFYLSPQLAVLLDDLMPVFYGQREYTGGGARELRDYVGWLITGLGGNDTGAISLCLPNGDEWNVMLGMFNMLVDIHEMLGGNIHDLPVSEWAASVWEIDRSLNDDRLCWAIHSSPDIAADDDKKRDAIASLRDIARGVKLERDVQGSFAYLHWSMRGGVAGSKSALSERARIYIYTKFIIPSLASRGHIIAQQIQFAMGDRDAMIRVIEEYIIPDMRRTEGYDAHTLEQLLAAVRGAIAGGEDPLKHAILLASYDLDEAYCDARQEGLSPAQRLRLSADGLDALGVGKSLSDAIARVLIFADEADLSDKPNPYDN
jgi:hypothetical protein